MREQADEAKKICRNRKEEVIIDFEDGTRFSIDWREDEFDLSIIGILRKTIRGIILKYHLGVNDE